MRRPVEAHGQRSGQQAALGGVIRETPLRGEHPGERGEELLCRYLFEVTEGVEEPRAKVDPAPRHREEPSVAREQHVAVPQIEPRLEPRPRAVGRPVVAASRDPQRPGVVASDARRPGEPPGRAVRRDDEPGSDPRGVGVLVRGRTHLGALHPAVDDHGRDRFGLLHQASPGLHGPLHEQVIESVPRHHEPVSGERGQFGPRQLEHGVPRIDAKTDHLLEAGVLGVDPHVADRRDPARRQTVAADLLARERGPLDDGDVDPVPGEVIGGRRATRTGPHDQDVRVDRVLRDHASPSAAPPPAGLVKNFTSIDLQATAGRRITSRLGAPRPGDPTSRPWRGRRG